jgi:hypothetical protein
METPFRFPSSSHSALLQKIPVDVGTSDGPRTRESYANEFTLIHEDFRVSISCNTMVDNNTHESTRIVVPRCLSITEGLQYGIALQNLLLEQSQSILRLDLRIGFAFERMSTWESDSRSNRS